MKPYEAREFCKSIDCTALQHGHKSPCETCKAALFHQYLSANNQILEVGSELEKVVPEVERLRAENESLTKGQNSLENINFDLKREMSDLRAENERLKTVAEEAQTLLNGGGTARLKYQQGLSNALKTVGLEGQRDERWGKEHNNRRILQRKQ